MPTFLVKMRYEGYHSYEIEANNENDAEDIANDMAHCADFESGFFEVEKVECIDIEE